MSRGGKEDFGGRDHPDPRHVPYTISVDEYERLQRELDHTQYQLEQALHDVSSWTSNRPPIYSCPEYQDLARAYRALRTEHEFLTQENKRIREGRDEMTRKCSVYARNNQHLSDSLENVKLALRQADNQLQRKEGEKEVLMNKLAEAQQQLMTIKKEPEPPALEETIKFFDDI